MITQRFALLVISPIVLALVACGNDDTPAVAATSLSGQVVKGPVGASTVCVYAITGGVKATATLVPCVTSDNVGNYTFASISHTGDMLVEATGGSYKDEATGATVTLSTPLRTIVPAQGGATTGVVTPLTTIAVSSSASLSSSAFAQAAANVAAQAGLSATNILTTLPTYATNGTTASNAYAAALGGIAKYQQTSGGTLAAALAAWSPANQAAFQSALNAYAGAASVIAANLPAAFNMAATGTAYSFSVASSNGVSSAGGLVSSTSLTLTGAGAGFQPVVGIGLGVTNTAAVVNFTGLTSLLAVAKDSGGTNVSYIETATQKAWTFDCKTGCDTSIKIDTTGKIVTFTNVTLTGSSGGATGTITVNGSASFQ
jgi:hypothetical protein